MAQSDQDLIGRISRRDASALEALVARYEDRLHRHLAAMVRDDAAAEDLIQEVFLRVWTRSDQWEARGTFEAWLFRIATNLALNYMRSVRRRKERPLDVPKDSAPTCEDDEPHFPSWMIDVSSLGAHAVLDMKERRELFRHVVDRLPEEQREVMRLVIDAQMDIRGVADALGIPEGTVKSRIHYAKKRLGRQWKDMDSE